MGSRFLLSFSAAFVAMLAILYGVSWLVVKIALATSSGPPSEQFLTSYFQFDLAPGWACEIDGTEYVCTPPGKPPHAAIAVVVMKERNKDDRLEAYEAHLKQPRADGAMASEVRFVRRSTLGGKEWVEALHYGSEIPNYSTYYLATTTSNLGILVTMSVARDNADNYVKQLTQMMSTLVVYQR